METGGSVQEWEMANRRPTPIVRDAEALLARGIEAVEYDRIEEAVGVLRQAAELAPDSHDVQLVLGIALMRSIDLSGAIAAFETAIELQPRSFFAHFRMGKATMRVGIPSRTKEYLGEALQMSTTGGTARHGAETTLIRTCTRPASGLATKLYQARQKEAKVVTVSKNVTLGATMTAALIMVFFFRRRFCR